MIKMCSDSLILAQWHVVIQSRSAGFVIMRISVLLINLVAEFPDLLMFPCLLVLEDIFISIRKCLRLLSPAVFRVGLILFLPAH